MTRAVNNKEKLVHTVFLCSSISVHATDTPSVYKRLDGLTAFHENFVEH